MHESKRSVIGIVVVIAVLSVIITVLYSAIMQSLGTCMSRPDDDDARSKTEDLLLSHLLKQLRPFQREAYEFCTQGIVSQRQFSSTDTSSASSEHNHNINNQNNRDKNASSPSSPSSIVCPRNLLGKGRVLLADEMGLGKTITSLAIMAHYRTTDWPLLILCPASLRHTWPGEIEKFMPGLTPSSIYVVSGFDDADFYENPSKRKKIQIVVATYSLLQKRSAAAHTLAQFQFQSIIVDESHNLKQKDSQRTQLALPLLRQAKRLVLLSGTPALARPVELWTQVSTLAPGLFGSSYTDFTKTYCNARRGRFGWDVSGLSNANQLHENLRKIMVRRLKSDVLHELPPKQRTVVEIPIPKGEKRKECESILQELAATRQSIEQLVGEDADKANFEARTLLMKAYQASGIAKSAGVCEYLLDWLRGSGSQKILVFGHHKGVLDALEVAVAKEFKGTGHIRIDGSVNSNERAALVRKFQTSSNIRVAILSMTAAGVGLTLTAATTVLFAELHWTPGVLAQAEDRCHRIGQLNAVNVLYLVSQDPDLSVDSHLWRMLGRKIGSLGRVIDGETNASMDAEVAQAGSPSELARGQSVQDELQGFFAETFPNDASSSNNKVPVKGTITSFFQKQKDSMKKVMGCKEDCVMVESSSEKLKTFSMTSILQSKTPPKVEWACETCTFINVKARTKSGWLGCDMCGTNHEDLSNTSHTITPSSHKSKVNSAAERNCTFFLQNVSHRKTSQEVPIVLDVDDHDHSDDNVKELRLSPKKLWNPIRLEGMTPASGELERTLFDKDDDHQIRKRKANAIRSDVVILDDFDTDGNNPSTSVRLASSCLRFSVSKHSGRITIHYASTNESSFANFDLDQVVSEATVNLLLEAKIHRPTTSRVRSTPLDFNSSAIQGVIKQLDDSKLSPRVERQKLVSEIEQFITSYQGLREVEKKEIRDSGATFSPFNLKQEALRLIVTSTHGCMQRYSGGAKEQAKEKMHNGIADSIDLAILAGNLCAWCGDKLPMVSNVAGVESTYCSSACSQQGRLKRGGLYASTRVREQVFALEGGVCRHCGIDAHALFTRISALQPVERLNALMNANWKLPKKPKSLERLLQNPKEGDFWEADHIVAVAEGGGGCDLENLRTLCVPCHAEETDKLRARLKLRGGAPEAKIDPTQRDIRSLFRWTKSAGATKDSNKRLRREPL